MSLMQGLHQVQVIAFQEAPAKSRFYFLKIT